MKRRPAPRSLLRTAIVVVGAILAVVIAGNVVTFLTSRDRLPPDTYMADVDVSSLTIDQAISRTVQALQVPVTLRYQAATHMLQPAEVDFQLNAVVARLQLEKILRDHQGLASLPDYAVRRASEMHLTAPYQYSEEKLGAYLNNIASQRNQPPKVPQPNLATLTLSQGQDGLAMSVDEARGPVLAALASGKGRMVDLPVDVIPVGSVALQSLGALVTARLADFTNAGNTAGVFIKDLGTGQEFSLNGDIAFSAQGWLKMAVPVEAFRAAGEPVDPQLAAKLAPIVVEGNTASANEALRNAGQGNAQAGADQLNMTLKRMGLVSTFLAQPFDQPTKAGTFVTPGNSRPDATTSPDPNAQSTPADVSLLLEMLDQCRQGSGGLLLAFAEQFTPDKCKQTLDTIGQNKINALLAAGSAGATVIHRQSWDTNNHGDVALVYSPGGTYVVAVMLHSNNPLSWAETSVLMSDIARAVYGYFNKNQVPAAVGALGAAPPP
jgi:hypothetical protein